MTNIKANVFKYLLLLAATFMPVTSRAADPPFELPKAGELNKLKSAVIYTVRGDLIFELYPEDAPWHVANFKYLADKGAFRGTRFHILVENHLIQARAASSFNPALLKYLLPAEFNQHTHELGTLGMARLPDPLNPQRESLSSEFHILLGEAKHLNGAYTIFGKLVRGFDALQDLRKGDEIKDIKVFVRE
jgi:cyclophilin family peptidyl-prolyl cis-trans isomerase